MLLGFFSCSNSEEVVDECGCVKTSYIVENIYESMIVDVEDVECVDEVFKVFVKKTKFGDLFYNIDCNY